MREAFRNECIEYVAAHPLTAEQLYMIDYQLYTPASTMYNLFSVMKVDKELLLLGGLYVVTVLFYILFEKVVVCVVYNANKKSSFLTLEERKEHVERVTADLPNVEVDTWDGLLVDYADKYDSPVVVRGLRAVSDFEYEFMMALTNKKLNNRVETAFLASDERYTYLSSSGVKEIAHFGGDFKQFLPEQVYEAVLEKIGGNR